MLTAQLAQMLESGTIIEKGSSVYIYIEGGLYYPIKSVHKDKDGNCIIVCKNIEKDKPE